MSRNTVLFDLGGTLAYYYDMSEFSGLLKQAVTEVQGYLLRERRLLQSSLDAEEIARRVREENYEAKDQRIRPLEDRLCRIFQLDASTCTDEFALEMCRSFMKPIFARGHCYDDSVPVLKILRSNGLKVGIISNTSWGSPAILWREEIGRLGFGGLVDATIFCRDVGWRKPAKQIFEFALQKLNSRPQDCLFVGDNPEWDLIGPRAVGMSALLIDRLGTVWRTDEKPIKGLRELLDRL